MKQRNRKSGHGLGRRSFLRQTSLGVCIVGLPAFVQQPRQSNRKSSAPSLNRQFARWVAGLRYEDLPPAAVDRAKGPTLQALSSVLLGSQSPAGLEAVKLVTGEEDGVRNGATIMVDGAKATKGGAAYANAEMALAGGKWDTFCMLTHPGTCIVPSAFAAAGAEGAS